MLGLVFKTSVRHFVSQVGSTPTSFRHNINLNQSLRSWMDLCVPLVHHTVIMPLTVYRRHIKACTKGYAA